MFRFVEVGENSLHSREEIDPRLGEGNDSGGARQQRCADFTLERGDRARDRGLGCSKLASGSGEAAASCDPHKQAEGV